MYKRFGAISFALLVSLLGFSSAHAVVPPDPMILIDQPETKINIAASLYIINSHAATLSKQNHKEMVLTLQNVEPYVTKFTGGIARKTSLSTTADIVQDWAHGKNIFSTSKPTAALAGVPLNGAKNPPNYILELSNPVYDAKHGTLSFKVKWTGGTSAPQSETTLTNVSLVVDDGLQVALNAHRNAFGNSVLASAKKF
jgi:hypothetical protein